MKVAGLLKLVVLWKAWSSCGSSGLLLGPRSGGGVPNPQTSRVYAVELRWYLPQDEGVHNRVMWSYELWGIFGGSDGRFSSLFCWCLLCSLWPISRGDPLRMAAAAAFPAGAILGGVTVKTLPPHRRRTLPPHRCLFSPNIQLVAWGIGCAPGSCCEWPIINSASEIM